MSTVMNIDEIEARFPDQWVLVIDPDTGPDLKVRSGVVAAHSKDRDEVYQRALELRPRRSAFLFTGPAVPAGTAMLL
jgi:hypothetical protein